MSKLLWLPIDIPKFPYPDMEITTETTWIFWSFGKITESRESPYDVSVIKKEILIKYPLLEEWFRNFPYKTIRNIKFNIQNSAVFPHIDFTKPEANPQLFANNSENEPCGYRILIRGSRTKMMYVVDNGEKVYVDIPEDTDVYVLRHSEGWHGVDDEEGRTTIFTHFEVDPEENKLLIDRSLDKYKDYAIWSKD
jgi:hypothetical protein